MNKINIIPKPAPRPRFSKFGTYNPKDYTDYKKAISLIVSRLHKEVILNACELTICLYMPIPKMSKKKHLAIIGQPHIKKPDLDNLIKGVKDAMNGIVYKDDSQVYKINAIKIYSEEPRIEYQISNKK